MFHVNKIVDPTGLLLEQVLFLVWVPYFWRLDLSSQFWVDVMAVANVVHAAAAARDDPLDLLCLLHLGGLVPV